MSFAIFDRFKALNNIFYLSCAHREGHPAILAQLAEEFGEAQLDPKT
jgi:hypothetical protein